MIAFIFVTDQLHRRLPVHRARPEDPPCPSNHLTTCRSSDRKAIATSTATPRTPSSPASRSRRAASYFSAVEVGGEGARHKGKGLGHRRVARDRLARVHRAGVGARPARGAPPEEPHRVVRRVRASRALRQGGHRTRAPARLRQQRPRHDRPARVRRLVVVVRRHRRGAVRADLRRDPRPPRRLLRRQGRHRPQRRCSTCSSPSRPWSSRSRSWRSSRARPASGGGGDTVDPKILLIIAIGIVSVPLLGRITRASALTWSPA